MTNKSVFILWPHFIDTRHRIHVYERDENVSFFASFTTEKPLICHFFNLCPFYKKKNAVTIFNVIFENTSL